MIEQIQFAKLFGVAHIDSLLQEMLLGGLCYNKTMVQLDSNIWIFSTADNSSPLTPPIAASYSPTHNSICSNGGGSSDSSQQVSSTIEPLSPMSPISPISPGSVVGQQDHTHNMHNNNNNNNNTIDSMDAPMLQSQFDSCGTSPSHQQQQQQSQQNQQQQYRRPTAIITNNGNGIHDIYRSYRADDGMLPSPISAIQSHSPPSSHSADNRRTSADHHHHMQQQQHSQQQQQQMQEVHMTDYSNSASSIIQKVASGHHLDPEQCQRFNMLDASDGANDYIINMKQEPEGSF